VRKRGGLSIVRRILLVSIACVLTGGGCMRPPPPDAEVLSGAWEIEIWRGRWARNPVHGQVTLAPGSIPECIPAEQRKERNGFLCRTFVKGTYSIALDSLVRPHPYAGWTAEAWAISFADGKILLNFGGCCDRGEIVATGRGDAYRVEGSWVQQFLSDGPGGRFVMRRAPARAPRSASSTPRSEALPRSSSTFVA
jgi:hypothetical protein